MNDFTKKFAYQALIEQVRNDYQSQPGGLHWCEDCQEINLWTYWQGRNNLDAKILLVGQDWGSPEDASALPCLSNIRKMNDGEQVPNMLGNESKTDWNLIRLFREIGYDIQNSAIGNKDLFFTNFVLGYRAKGFSGGFQKSWAMHDAPYFARLAEIIQPECILCLGRATFEGVLMAFHHRLSPRIRCYNRFIESERNPVTIYLSEQKPVRVFALAHCGVLGTLNRNRGIQDKASLQLQINDWRRIKNPIPVEKDDWVH